MKKIIIFLAILIIFSSLGYYLYTRISEVLVGTFLETKLVLVLFVFLLFSFLLGKLIEHFNINFVSNTLIRIGAVSLGFFLYALILIVFIDFIRLINYIIPFYPKFISNNIQQTKYIVGIVSSAIIFVVFLAGYINARTPIVKTVNIDINKNSDLGKLNIVAVSDIHLGMMVNHHKTNRLINKIKELNPDLVIIGGDIIDDNINVVKYFKLLEYFKELKPKYGVYACPGNHDYISNAYKEFEYFDKNGIKMLRDKAVLIDNKFYIVGRDDHQAKMFDNKKRKTLEELIVGLNTDLPIILLDHQPYKLEETARYPIDLQFSGHTHGGQLFPFNLITQRIFEKDYGYLKKENTHFYISSGYGTSMMPIRIASKSEIVNFLVE